jgi:hypothetical protein
MHHIANNRGEIILKISRTIAGARKDTKDCSVHLFFGGT